MLTDRDLLITMGLTFSEASKCIGISRQAFRRGILAHERRQADTDGHPNGDAHYLTLDRLLRIWRILKENRGHLNPPALGVLHSTIRERHPDIESFFQGIGTVVTSRSAFPFDELWVFSRNPVELRDLKYVERMVEFFNAPDKKLVYFLPNSILAAQLQGTICSVVSEPTNVYIVVSSAVALMPHWVLRIQCPKGQDQEIEYEARVEGEVERSFILCNKRNAFEVIKLLRTVGLADKHGRFSPKQKIFHQDNLPDFTIFFSPKGST